MGLFNSIFGSFVEKSVVHDAEKVVAVCRSYGPMERGELKACATMALAFLYLDCTSERDQTLEMVMEALADTRTVADRDRGLVSKLLLRMMSLQQQAHKSLSPVNQRIAAGMPVWIISLRSLNHVAVLPYARELWSILQSGDNLRAYDVVDGIERQLDGHPLGTAMMNIGMVSTPVLFQPH